MKIQIWGARGSIPSPLKSETIEEKICQAILALPQGIDLKDEAAVRRYVGALSPLQRGTAGGNTACVQIHAGKEIFILDAGSGLRELGLALMKGPCGRGEGVIHLFLSHPHWDHIQGFPFFTPAFIPGNQLYFYSVHDIEAALETQQQPLTFPISLSYMRANRTFIRIKEGEPFVVGPLTVNTIQNAHPGQAYSYRFEDQHSVFVYASDAEYQQLDDKSIQPRLQFFKNADALLFDAQYTLKEAWQKVDWGHGSAMIGVDLARASGAKRLLLFHYDPTYSDLEIQKIQDTALAYQAQNATLPPCEVIVAYEGMMLDLTPPGTVDVQLLPENEAAVLTPTSIFDSRGVEQLVQQLDALTIQRSTSTPIIDLSQVETLTTASLKALIALRRKEEGNAQVVLANPSASATEVIKLSGYFDFFACYPSVDAALDAIHAREALNLPGQMVKNRYRIERKIGEGQLGSVLKATDTWQNDIVALKIFSPIFSQETISRFIRRARQIVALDHPNIVKVRECDISDEYAFEVEEFMGQQTLHALLDESKPFLSADYALDIAVDITLALEFAHSHGVIHGDLKPQNIFLTENGAKLSGFGLGRLEEGRNLLDAPLLFLTADYLSPEQITGQTIDARTDLYALGVILYQLVTGQLPFSGTDAEVMQAHLYQQPRSPRELNPNISLSLEHLILKLLAKNPNDRYASAQQPRLISNSLIFSDKESTAMRGRALIGREHELKIMQDCWQEACRGHGQLAFITGELGVGKTRLARWAALQSHAPVLLMGNCQDKEGSPPYHPFIEALQAYFDMVPPELFDQDARQLLINFAHLLPKVRQSMPDLPLPIPLEPRQEQLRLMTCLTQFIKQATSDRPWFLILDNLQWADPSSLELLRYLGRHLPLMSLFIVGAYRDDAPEQTSVLRQTLQSLKRHPTYQLLSLERLNVDETGRLLANIWMQTVPTPLVEKIFHHTGGNPFYIEEVANGLSDDGHVYLQRGLWHFPEVDEVRLPDNVRDAIWRRVRHLSPDTQTLLRSASILGQSFCFDDLKEMSDLSEREVLEHLDMALERQLVHETASETILRFSQTEVHSVLYADIGPLRRRFLHGMAGDALEKRAQPHPERIAEELAHHFTEANQPEKAVKYSALAAQQAQKAHANESALQWYNRTLAMMDQLDPQTAMQLDLSRLSVHLSLGEVLTLMGWYDEALEHYAMARSLLEVKKSSAGQARHLVDLYRRIAEVHEKRNEYDNAFEWFKEGQKYIDEINPTIEAARLYLLGARLYYQLGEDDQAMNWCGESLAMTDRLQSREARQVVGYMYCCLSNIASRRGEMEQKVSHCRKSVEIFEQIDDPVGQSVAHNHLGQACFELGNWPQANQAYNQSRAIAQEVGDIYQLAMTLNNLAVLQLSRGLWQETQDLLQQSLSIWRQIEVPWGEAVALSHLAQTMINRTNWPQAREYLSAAQTLFIETGYFKEEVSELERRWGEYYLKTGDFVQAKAHIDRATALAIELNAPWHEAISRRMLGKIYLTQGSHAIAEVELRQSLQILRRLNCRYEIARTEIGLVYLSLEYPVEDRQNHLSRAMATFEAIGAQVDLIEARSLQAQL